MLGDNRIRNIQFFLKQKQKPISFLEDEHKYFYGDKEFMSVTTFISRYFEDFDVEFHAKRIAEQEGKTIEEVKNSWEKIRQESAEYGTKVHALLEKFIDTHYFDKEEYNKKESYFQGIKLLTSKRIGYGFATEVVVYDVEHRLAGQIDLLTYKDGDIILADWKTSLEIDVDNKFETKMKVPFEYLPGTNYIKYSMQLSMYAYFLEKWGLKVNKLYILHIPKGNWKIYKVKYYDKQIRRMLKDRFKEVYGGEENGLQEKQL